MQDAIKNGTTSTTTDDTTDKDGGDDEGDCNPCWEYYPLSSGGPRKYKNHEGDKFGGCWETEMDYFYHRCQMDYAKSEEDKQRLAKQARYAACCASYFECGWMKGKENKYNYRDWEMTYWADKSTNAELGWQPGYINDSSGKECPKECWGR